MTISLKTIDMQLAQDTLRKELAKIAGDRYITVGIHEGAPPVEGADINMATLGAVLNFGSGDGHIPARPWLVPGVEAGTPAILQSIADDMADGLPVDQIMERAGLIAVGEVKQFMNDLSSPPNAASTIAKKGSSNPLIDTGALRESVTHVVHRGKPSEGL